jgi:hypothetical protein
MNMRETGDVKALMRDIGVRARSAARVLGLAESAQKTDALEAAGKAPSAPTRQKFLQRMRKTSKRRKNRTSPLLSSIASRSRMHPSMRLRPASRWSRSSPIPSAK